MKSTLLAIATIILLGLGTGCKKCDVPNDIPECIRKQIEKIKSEPVRNPPGSVWQYEYNGNIVYFIPSYCCDVQSEVLDKNCNVICRPDGGITGGGDGRCEDFFDKRKNEKLIWQDTRK